MRNKAYLFAGLFPVSFINVLGVSLASCASSCAAGSAFYGFPRVPSHLIPRQSHSLTQAVARAMQIRIRPEGCGNAFAQVADPSVGQHRESIACVRVQEASLPRSATFEMTSSWASPFLRRRLLHQSGRLLRGNAFFSRGTAKSRPFPPQYPFSAFCLRADGEALLPRIFMLPRDLPAVRTYFSRGFAQQIFLACPKRPLLIATARIEALMGDLFG